MNITFLIGNGFDVGLGMKSKFKDFFPIYKEKSKNKEVRIKQLSDSIEGNYDTWADFEKALGEYTLQFNTENKQDFIDQAKDFQLEFIAYLKEQEACLSFNESEKIASKMTVGLTQFYSLHNLATDSNNVIAKLFDKKSAEQHIYNFVNFNYTSLLSKAMQTIPQNVVCKRKHNGNERVDKVVKVIHVHGYCENWPIIGVNDPTQIANKELAKDLRFVRYIVKPTINQYLRQGFDRDATNIINNSTIICIYGMSLGATDKKWWDLLIQWLSASSERQLVLFDYDDKYSSATPYGWLEKEDFILDKLDQYNSNKNITAESLRSRIHIAVHKNIFQMKLKNSRGNTQESSQGRILGNIFATEPIISNAVQINNALISNDNYLRELEIAQKAAEGIPLLIK